MFALVGYATRHGSTREIAERIATTLVEHGATVELRTLDQVGDVRPYDAVVIGSAVYSGRWLAEATAFVRRQLPALAQLPVWMFSVGRLPGQGGLLRSFSPPRARELAEFRARLHPRDHRIFGGAVLPERLSAVQRLVFRAAGGRYGDFRDWDEIDAWAEGIARKLEVA
jgi:menaquinone-dependent protoporphyrinogen oxidase